MYVHIEVDHFKFKKVNNFIYLNIIVSEKNDMTKKVDAKIQAGSETTYGLTKLLSTLLLLTKIKKRLYTTYLETWTLRKLDENEFLIVERKILRTNKF